MKEDSLLEMRAFLFRHYHEGLFPFLEERNARADEGHHLIVELMQCEPLYRRAVDDACESFAQKEKWPELERDHRLLAFLRIWQADSLAASIETSPLAGVRVERRAFLRWILVDYWRDIGADRAKARANEEA